MLKSQIDEVLDRGNNIIINFVSGMNVPNDPNPIHLHLFTSLCSTKSLIACSCVSDAWRANLSWLLKSTAKLPIPLKPWLGTDLISQTQTQAWTRSYTIYEALRRHHLLTPNCKDATQLCIAVVGTDVVEGDTIESTIASFAPLCTLLAGNPKKSKNRTNQTDQTGQTNQTNPTDQNDSSATTSLLPPSSSSITTLIIVLNGMDLLIPDGVSEDASWNGTINNISLTLIWCPGKYTKELIRDITPPNLIICFNAGLWGYDTWKETLVWIMLDQLPLIITSYTWRESDDDQCIMNEVMNEINKDTENENDKKIVHWIWRAERNPFGSTVEKESYHKGEILRDNSWWMSTK